MNESVRPKLILNVHGGCRATGNFAASMRAKGDQVLRGSDYAKLLVAKLAGQSREDVSPACKRPDTSGQW